MGPPYGKLPMLFPYHSHKNPLWEAYHKGVPLLGVPGITLEYSNRTSLLVLCNSPGLFLMLGFKHLVMIWSWEHKSNFWNRDTKEIEVAATIRFWPFQWPFGWFIRDLFRGENVTSIWGNKRSLGRSWNMISSHFGFEYFTCFTCFFYSYPYILWTEFGISEDLTPEKSARRVY